MARAAFSSTPLYSTGNRVTDLEVGVHVMPSWFTYGTGCAGAPSPSPHFEFVNLPALGNAQFAHAVSGGPPSSLAVLIIGFSRLRFAGASLPLPLDPVGMPGCSLLTASHADIGTGLDPRGAGSVVIPIPNQPSLAGGEFSAQWFVLDPAANPLGVAASEGAVAIMR